MSSEQFYARSITQNLRFDGPVLMRDGRSAILRESTRDDLPLLVELLERTSSQSINMRFFGPMRRNEKTAEFLIRDHLEGVDSGRFHGLSLVLLAGSGEKTKIMAVASCVPLDREQAEIAFLVDDDAHGRGIGTLLIERLAYAAELGGMKKLVATTVAENDVMARVFRDCGYNVTSRMRTGEIHVEFEIAPSEQSLASMERRDQTASRASIEPFFHPESIAIISSGADTDPESAAIISNLQISEYSGAIHVVYLDGGKHATLPSVAQVSALPAAIDLIVVTLGADQTIQAVQHCIENGCRALLVTSGGFAETSRQGQQIERELLALVRENGMRLVGPNSLGLISTDPQFPLNLTFAKATPPSGNLAMSCQSESLSLAVLDGAADYGIGFSSFINVGNKADISGNDLMQYWEDDDRTKLILLYLENLGNPRRFARIARRVSRKKPILVIRGSRVAQSHLQEDSFFQQLGVIQSETLEQMFDLANLLSHQPLIQGRHVAVLSNSRGVANICAQTLVGSGLQLATNTSTALQSLQLPEGAVLENPVDLTPAADPSVYQQALEQLLKVDKVDAIVAIYIARDSRARDDIIEAIHQARHNTESWNTIPLVCCFMDRLSEQPDIRGAEEKIPSYHYPESAALALAKAYRYSNWLRRPAGIIPVLEQFDLDKAWSIIGAAEQRSASVLDHSESVAVLEAIGIEIGDSRSINDAASAAAASSVFGFPLALHTGDPDTNAVIVEDQSAFSEHWSQERPAIAFQEQEGALPLVISFQDDGEFGPIALFGLGGIAADIFHDQVCRITPLSDQDAIEMLHEINVHPLLDGYGSTAAVDKNARAVDKEAIIDVLLRLSWLIEEAPVVSEIHLIGCYASATGVNVACASILLRSESGSAAAVN